MLVLAFGTVWDSSLNLSSGQKTLLLTYFHVSLLSYSYSTLTKIIMLMIWFPQSYYLSLTGGLWGPRHPAVQPPAGFWPRCVRVCGHQSQGNGTLLGPDPRNWRDHHLLGESDSTQVHISFSEKLVAAVFNCLLVLLASNLNSSSLVTCKHAT